jgi:hypothetical protein
MTRRPLSSFVGDEGTNAVERVLVGARTIAHRVPGGEDVGIDILAEPTESDGMVSGIFGGIQVKSGGSYVDGSTFRFVAERKHFAYWARCSLPAIGVVYDPAEGRMVWVDLFAESTPERVRNGPYSLTVDYGEETRFDSDSFVRRVLPLWRTYAVQRLTCGQVRQLVAEGGTVGDLALPGLLPAKGAHDVWYGLIQTLLDPTRPFEEVADAGHRLSWYYPAVDEEQKSALRLRLRGLSDEALLGIIGAIAFVCEREAEPVGELIADLLAYSPGASTRIIGLLKAGVIPAQHREWAIQTIEYLEEAVEPRSDLRDAYGREDAG